jgi:NitT/TauT family transport system permease protein
VTPTFIVSHGRYATLEEALRPRGWLRQDWMRQAALGIVGVAAFFSLWSLLTYLGLIDRKLLPTPDAIAVAFGSSIEDGTLARELGHTLSRVLTGFAIGTSAGLAVGFAMALSRHAKAVIYPVFMATFPLPKIALLPLSMVYLGVGDAPIVAVVALSAFYVLPVNVMAAIGNIDKVYRDVAQNLNVTPSLFRRSVAFPYALPMVLAATRSAWAISLIVVIAAEMLVGGSGLGFLIWQSVQAGEIEVMFSSFVTIGILGYGSHLLIDGLTRLLVPWQVNV